MAETVSNPSGAQAARCRGPRQHRLARPTRQFGDVDVARFLPGIHGRSGRETGHYGCRLHRSLCFDDRPLTGAASPVWGMHESAMAASTSVVAMRGITIGEGPA